MTFGSVFSGIGGIDLGLERAGWTCAWQIERDPAARTVLKRHWPGVPLHSDVRGALALRRVDLVSGGPPCQPFSFASSGKRRGTEDHRWLWPPMRRIVQALRPSWVLVENVPGFDGAGLEQVVSDLEADDYQVAPTLEVPACAFGHDHRRSRLWVLGYSDNKGKPRVPVDAEVAVLPFGGGDQPDELGEAFRVPDWVDRMRLLGNSVVPDEAEWIGKLILEA